MSRKNSRGDSIDIHSVVESINLMDEAHLNIANLIDMLDNRDQSNSAAITSIDTMEGLLNQFSIRHTEMQYEISTLLESSKQGALSHDQLTTYFSNEQLRSNYIINIVDSLKSQIEGFHKLFHSTLLNEMDLNDDTAEVANNISDKLNLIMKSINSLGDVAISSSKKMRQTVQSIDRDVMQRSIMDATTSTDSTKLIPGVLSRTATLPNKRYTSSPVDTTNDNDTTLDNKAIGIADNDSKKYQKHQKNHPNDKINDETAKNEEERNIEMEAEIKRRVELALKTTSQSFNKHQSSSIASSHQVQNTSSNSSSVTNTHHHGQHPTASSHSAEYLVNEKQQSQQIVVGGGGGQQLSPSLTTSPSSPRITSSSHLIIGGMVIGSRSGSPNNANELISNIAGSNNARPAAVRLVSSPSSENHLNRLLKSANNTYDTNYTSLAEIEEKLAKIIEWEAKEDQRKVQMEIDIRRRIEEALSNSNNNHSLNKKNGSKSTNIIPSSSTIAMVPSSVTHDQEDTVVLNKRIDNTISSNGTTKQASTNSNNKKSINDMKKNINKQMKASETAQDTTIAVSTAASIQANKEDIPSNKSKYKEGTNNNGLVMDDESIFPDNAGNLTMNTHDINNLYVTDHDNNQTNNDSTLEVIGSNMLLPKNNKTKSDTNKNNNFKESQSTSHDINQNNTNQIIPTDPSGLLLEKDIKHPYDSSEHHPTATAAPATVDIAPTNKGTIKHDEGDANNSMHTNDITTTAANRIICKNSFEELEYERQQLANNNNTNTVQDTVSGFRGLPAPTRYDLFNKIYRNVSDMKKYNMIRIQAPDLELKDMGTCTALDDMYMNKPIVISTPGALLLGGLTDMTGTLDDLSIGSNNNNLEQGLKDKKQHDSANRNMNISPSNMKGNNKKDNILTLEQYDQMKSILQTMNTDINPNLSNYFIDKCNPNTLIITSNTQYNEIKDLLYSSFDKEIANIMISHLPKPYQMTALYSPVKELPIYASTESGDFLTRTYKIQNQPTPRITEEIAISDNPLLILYEQYQMYLSDIHRARLFNASIINNRITELIPKSHIIHKLISFLLDSMTNITGICNHILQLLETCEEIIKIFIKKIKINPNVLTLIVNSSEIVDVSRNFGEIEAMKMSIDLQMIEYRSFYERVNTLSLHELENCCKQSKDFDYAFKYYLTNQGKIIEISQRLERCKDRIKRYNLFNHLHQRLNPRELQSTNNVNSIEDSEYNMTTMNQNQMILIDQLRNEIEELKEQLQEINEDYHDQEVEMLEVMKNNDKSPDALLFFAMMHDPAYLQNLQQLTLQMKQIKPFVDGKEHVDFVTLRKRLQICVVMTPNIDKLINKYQIMYKKWSQYRLNWFAERKLNGGAADAFNSCPLCFQMIGNNNNNNDTSNNNNNHTKKNKRNNQQMNTHQIKSNKIETLQDAGITITSQFSSSSNHHIDIKTNNKLPILVHDR